MYYALCNIRIIQYEYTCLIYSTIAYANFINVRKTCMKDSYNVVQRQLVSYCISIELKSTYLQYLASYYGMY